MPPEILKYDWKAKTVSCSPEAVAHAVNILKPTADEAKNALTKCNENVQAYNKLPGITSAGYRMDENNRLARGYGVENALSNDRARLAELLGLKTVNAHIEAKNQEKAIKNLTEHTQATTAATEKATQKSLQEQAAAAKIATEEKKTATAQNEYSGLGKLGKTLQGVFGNKKVQ